MKKANIQKTLLQRRSYTLNLNSDEQLEALSNQFNFLLSKILGTYPGKNIQHSTTIWTAFPSSLRRQRKKLTTKDCQFDYSRQALIYIEKDIMYLNNKTSLIFFLLRGLLCTYKGRISVSESHGIQKHNRSKIIYHTTIVKKANHAKRVDSKSQK